jgi:hypothetical protein
LTAAPVAVLLGGKTVVGGLVVSGTAVVLAAVVGGLVAGTAAVGGLVVSGTAVVLAAVVGGLVAGTAAVGGLVVSGTAVVLAAVVGGLVAGTAAVGGLVPGAPVAGGAAEVLVDCGTAVVEERARVVADEVATVLDGAAGPVITGLVEESAGTATVGTVPSPRVADLVWKLTTAARPAIVAATTIGARLIEFAPGLQPSA